MNSQNKPLRYHWALVLLHWLLALAIPVMLLAGMLILAPNPNSNPDKVNQLRGHMAIGMIVAVLMVLRLIVRTRTQHPAQLRSGIMLADKLAPWVHRLMYQLVFVMIGSGIAMSVYFGLPAVVFEGVGQLPTDFTAFFANKVHHIVAKILLVVIVLHIGAVLYHRFVLNDGLLSRMRFGKNK